MEADIIPDELLEIEVFYKLPGPLVSKWNEKKTNKDFVTAVINETIVHPTTLSPEDKKVN